MQKISKLFKYEKNLLFLENNYEFILKVLNKDSNKPYSIQIFDNELIYQNNKIQIGFTSICNQLYLLDCNCKSLITYKRISLIIYKDLKESNNILSIYL